ncbi:hypothetical protein AAMO2058_000697700 [Amorphochlora amoebiformis]
MSSSTAWLITHSLKGGIALIEVVWAIGLLTTPCDNIAKRRIHYISLMVALLFLGWMVWLIIGIDWRSYIVMLTLVAILIELLLFYILHIATAALYKIRIGNRSMSRIQRGNPPEPSYGKMYLALSTLLAAAMLTSMSAVMITNQVRWNAIRLIAIGGILWICGSFAVYLLSSLLKVILKTQARTATLVSPVNVSRIHSRSRILSATETRRRSKQVKSNPSAQVQPGGKPQIVGKSQTVRKSIRASTLSVSHAPMQHVAGSISVRASAIEAENPTEQSANEASTAAAPSHATSGISPPSIVHRQRRTSTTASSAAPSNLFAPQSASIPNQSPQKEYADPDSKRSIGSCNGFPVSVQSPGGTYDQISARGSYTFTESKNRLPRVSTSDKTPVKSSREPSPKESAGFVQFALLPSLGLAAVSAQPSVTFSTRAEQHKDQQTAATVRLSPTRSPRTPARKKRIPGTPHPRLGRKRLNVLPPRRSRNYSIPDEYRSSQRQLPLQNTVKHVKSLIWILAIVTAAGGTLSVILGIFLLNEKRSYEDCLAFKFYSGRYSWIDDILFYINLAMIGFALQYGNMEGFWEHICCCYTCCPPDLEQHSAP